MAEPPLPQLQGSLSGPMSCQNCVRSLPREGTPPPPLTITRASAFPFSQHEFPAEILIWGVGVGPLFQ